MKLSTQTLEDLKEQCIEGLKAVNSDMTTLQQSRADALNAYLSRPYGNEIDGRSRFVTSDVADTVDSIMPSLMKTFYGSANVVSIKPVGPEDERAAKLMEQKVNYDFTSGINGYRVFDTWFRDALFQKLGVVKYYWSEETEKKSVEYEDLTEAEYINLLQKVDSGQFEIIKEKVETTTEAEFDQLGVMMRPAEVRYSVEGKKIREICKPVVTNIPPEEFIFDIRAKSLADSAIVAHKKRVHKSYLAKYNVSESEVVTEIYNFETNSLYQTRFQDLGGVQYIRDANDPDYCYIYECYTNLYHANGDPPTPYKITILGNRVIDAEENRYGRPPFCTLTPITIPHRLVGRDYYDLVGPIQELNTYYIRYINDNLAFQNNGMRIVNPFRVQMDDVINENAPGAIWRTRYDIDPSRVATPITPTPLAPEVYGLLERMDVIRQERSGVTKYQQGLDSKSLNRTATGISQIMGAAQQRVENLVRHFAETGVTDLFQALVDMNLDFFDAEVAIRINNDWAQITPDQIDGKFDILVDVSSSFGASEIRSNQMLQALNTYQMLKQGGTPIPVKYELNILREWWSVQGYKDVDSYAPSPDGVVNDMVEQQSAMMKVQQQVQQMMPQPPQGMAPQMPPERA